MAYQTIPQSTYTTTNQEERFEWKDITKQERFGWKDILPFLLTFLMIVLLFVLAINESRDSYSKTIFSSNYPVLRVDSFSVSNFNPSLPKSFAPKWEVNVTVRNPNSGLKASFDEIKSKVYYKEDILFSDRLASTSSHPFSMETNTRTVMQSKLSANRKDIAMMGKSILDKMFMDKKNGIVSFNLQFDLRVTFDHDQQGDWLFSRHTTKDLNVECNNIKVGFVDGVASDGNAASRDRLNGPLFCVVNAVDGDAF